MTPREERFIREYLLDLNVTAAAIRAGYAPGGAQVTGRRVLARKPVRAAIDAAIAEREARLAVTADRVIEAYARIAFADIGRLIDWGPDGVRLLPAEEISPEDLIAVAEVATGAPGARGGGPRLRLHDKQLALDRLARHLGLFEPAPPPAMDPAALAAERAEMLATLEWLASLDPGE